ncbi:hypothetical protein [Streptomyces virginiae]
MEHNASLPARQWGLGAKSDVEIPMVSIWAAPNDTDALGGS